MIYFRNYRIRVNEAAIITGPVRDANGNILRGVTPKAFIAIIHNPEDMGTYAQSQASGLTSDEARRKAVFRAKRRFMEIVKTKKPSLALLSDGQYRVTAVFGGGRVMGYANTPGGAYDCALHNRMEMDRIIDDIIEPSPTKRSEDTHVTKKWRFWDWFR